MQTYRFYGGNEAKKDKEYIDFYTEVLKKLTHNSKSLRKIYNIPDSQ